MESVTHIAFTICSNNYLGQALALRTSFFKHNPNFEFYIVLVDKPHESIDYDVLAPANLVMLAGIDGINVDDLISRYNIIELNTSIKPSVFKFLLKKHPEVDLLYYLDPDLYFYNSLEDCNIILESKLAVLTPHIVTPIPRDGKFPDENVFLNYGIYNLGFLGINARNTQIFELLDWWEERTLMFGYDQTQKGYFVDQLWMVQAPLFFNDIEVLKTFNYNMAPWNLHERKIEKIEGDRILLNDGTYLVFYHFSKITGNESDISKKYNRYTFTDLSLLREIYNDYYRVLEVSNFKDYQNIPVAFDLRQIPIPKLNNSKSNKQKNKRNSVSKVFLWLANRFNIF